VSDAVDATLARLARASLAARGLYPNSTSYTLGTISLLPHQRAAVHWLVRRIARFRGALLADPPGLGKTFVALAVADQLGCEPLVIAPAALRDQWRDAARRAGVCHHFISTERLSAPRALPPTRADFVIIDEAHHLRTPSTRRHHRVVQLCARARVLLLSATPIHNHRADLHNIAALFHVPTTESGVRRIRRQMTLQRSIGACDALNRSEARRYRIPVVKTRWLPTRAVASDSVADLMLALPRLASSGDDHHALLILGLLHAWRSSHRALARRLERRRAVLLSIEHACDAGVAPTVGMRRAFRCDDGDVQLAMASLFADANSELPRATLDALRHSAQSQRIALEHLHRQVNHDASDPRAPILRRIARWSAAPVVAFTQFTATAHSLYRALHPASGIALLTGSSARIASGVLSRNEVLERLLSPRFRTDRDGVRLLITTDVLSEGLNLAGVGTVIHLDQPWTAARLDQRVGRAARIGVPLDSVTELFLPSVAPAAVHAHVARVLERKRVIMAQMQTPAGPARDEASLITSLVATAGGKRCCSQGKRHASATDQAAAAHNGVCTRVTLAIVQLRGRRTLVAFENNRLRSPTSTDWTRLLTGANETPASLSVLTPTTERALRDALAAHLAESGLSDRLRPLAASMLVARREHDTLLRATRGAAQLRTIHASRAQASHPAPQTSQPNERTRVWCGITITMRDARPM
jgi:superfamily II DNA or RNA helicase